MNDAPAPSTAPIRPIPGIAAVVKALAFEPGLYALSIEAAREERGELGGIALPATSIAISSAGGNSAISIIGASTRHDWIGPDGGTVAVRVPPPGGCLLVTTYRVEARPARPISVQISRLDHDRTPPDAAAPVPIAPVAHEVALEIVAQHPASPAVTVRAGTWAGEPGRKVALEAFSIRPLETLQAIDIAYKAFAPHGRETPWIGGGGLCGGTGRGMPLTGFAVQVTPTLRDRFDVVYEGWFFEAGDPVERRNGEPCFSPLANDPLGAIRIRLLERRLQPRPAGEPAPTPSSPPPATPLAAEAAASPRPAPAKRVRAAGVRKPKPAAGRR